MVGLIDLNKYLTSFPGSNLTDKNDETELNDILLNSMPNRWSKQSHVQGFGFKYISFKKYVNMFLRMDITESVYGGVVEFSHKTLPGQIETVMVKAGIRYYKPPCIRLVL